MRVMWLHVCVQHRSVFFLMVALSAEEHISSFSLDGLYTVVLLMGGNPLILKRLYNSCPNISMKV